MAISLTKKYVGFLGAVLGILQGLAWAIMSFMVILLYSEAWEPYTIENIKKPPKTYGAVLDLGLYALYIIDSEDKEINDLNLILTPQVVMSISVVYLITSLAWIVSSFMVIHALVKENYSNLRVIFKSWSSICIITSGVDFVVLILSVLDFLKSLEEGRPFELPNATGIIMTIAARGFTLWVVNVALGVLFFLFSADVQHENQDNTPRHIPSQSAFISSPTPIGNVNKAYNWEGDQPTYPNSNPYAPPQNYGKPEVLPKPTAKPNERLAKIGKPPARMPPQNVPPPRLPTHSSQKVFPRVPSPDYSPPNSPIQPQLKSVLKGRPQNTYGGYSYSNN